MTAKYVTRNYFITRTFHCSPLYAVCDEGRAAKKNIAKNTHYRLFPTLSRSPYVCIGRGIMQKYTNNNIALKHKPQ